MVISRLRGVRTVSNRMLEGAHPVRALRIALPELDLDKEYLGRFDVDGLLEGDFLLINEHHEVDLCVWSVPDASHLWNFNLHYFEYGIALAARYRETGERRWLECFKRLVSSWMRACPYHGGDAWHPYTISLRLVNWLVAIDLFDGALERDQSFFAAMCESMYLQYRHLLINQETHLRANHYWENVKTLVIMAAVFDEKDVLDHSLRWLSEQLDEQILPDGVHFERSLMYHKLMIEGMLRLWHVSQGMRFKLPAKFLPMVELMLDAMASLERGMGKTPFFNDSADGVSKTCDQLRVAGSRLLGYEVDDSKAAFPDAGYYKLYQGPIAVMFDAGVPGPSYMLGHAHCDCLSFELSFDGVPIIVNSGTYAYQSELRPYFRSTAAHNTVMVDGVEQLECWGEHRVARGYDDCMVEAFGKGHIAASFRDYQGNYLRREIRLSDSRLDIEDTCSLSAKRTAELAAWLHFRPGTSYAIVDDRIRVSAGGAGECVEVYPGGVHSMGDRPVSSEFSVLGMAPSIELCSSGGGKLCCQVTIGTR